MPDHPNQPQEYDAVLGGQTKIPPDSAVLGGIAGVKRRLGSAVEEQTLVSGGHDTTLKIWNLQTRELIRTLEGHSDRVNTVAISPDGQTLVSGSCNKTIRVWGIR